MGISDVTNTNCPHGQSSDCLLNKWAGPACLPSFNCKVIGNKLTPTDWFNALTVWYVTILFYNIRLIIINYVST